MSMDEPPLGNPMQYAEAPAAGALKFVRVVKQDAVARP